MSHPTPAQIITRADGPHLIVQALGDEVVVFDRNKNKAHLLSPVAASIWRAAEGGCRIDALTHLAGGESKERSLELTRLAIFELERAGLIVTRQGRGSFVAERAGLSLELRRQELDGQLAAAADLGRRLGLSADALAERMREVARAHEGPEAHREPPRSHEES